MPPMLSLCLYRLRIVRNLGDDARAAIERIWDRGSTGEDDEPLDGRSEEAQDRVRNDDGVCDVGLCFVHGRGLLSFEKRDKAYSGLLRRGRHSRCTAEDCLCE